MNLDLVISSLLHWLDGHDDVLLDHKQATKFPFAAIRQSHWGKWGRETESKRFSLAASEPDVGA